MPVSLYLQSYNGGAAIFDPGASLYVPTPTPVLPPPPPPPPLPPASSQPAVDVQPADYRPPSTNLVVPIHGALPDAGGTYAGGAMAAAAPLAAPTIGGAPFWAIVAIAVLLLFLVR